MINTKSIISDASNLLTYQNLLPEYSFKKQGRTYRAGRNGGVYLKEDSNGILKAYFPNGDYQNGNVLSIAAQILNQDLKTFEGLKSVCMYVCMYANLDFSKYCNDTPGHIPQATPSVSQPIETKAFLPNAGQPLSKSFDYELATPDSFTYKAVSKYYERKTGVKQPDLNKLGVFPLQYITYIHTGKKTIFNHKKIGVGYFPSGLSENIKVKIIDLESKGKKQMFTIQNTGNYVFGLNNLPTESRKDFTLLLCAGEDDTNAINTHLQPFGFCALTFGSESAIIPTDYLSYLQSQFKAVFSILDNDKTGIKMAIRNATANGLPYVSIGDYYDTSVNDVCDIYNQFGSLELLKLVKVEVKTKTAPKTDFERIGYNLHKVLNLDVNQYITEKLQYLKSYISTNQKLLLQSPTDTGKTTAIVEMSKDAEFYKSLDIESIVLAVPRLLLAEQLREVFRTKTGVTPSVIDGKSSSIDIQEAYQNKVIICTYDSLKKLQNHLKDCLLVIDEIHLLTEDSGFRSEVTAKVYELIPKAKRVLGLTATPNFEMCVGMQLNEKFIPEEIREALNFTLCKVSLSKAQSKKLQLTCYPESRINAVTAYAENIIQGNEKAAVLLNDVKVLETVSQLINDKYSESTATILSSKKAAYNIENPTYNAIVKGEAIPNENRLFLGTNVLTTGVSLNFAVENLAIFGSLDSRTITQFSARPRLKGDINKRLNVDVFKTVSKSDFDTISSDFEQCNIETPESLKDRRNALELLQNDIQTAVTLCEAANKLPNKSDEVRRKIFDELDLIYFDESNNEFKINLTAILYNHNQRIEKRLTVYGKFLKAKQYDNTFDILPPQYVNFKKNQQATDILSDKKEAAKENKMTALEVFSENKNACLEIAFKQTNDYDLKGAIKTEVAINKNLSDRAKEIKVNHPSVIDHLPSIAGRYFDLKAAASGVDEITPKTVLSMLTNVTKESDFKLLKNRIISLSELRNFKNDTLTNAESIRAERSKIIIESMRNFEKSKRRNWLTSSEVIKIVSDSLKRRVELKEAKMRISELFEVFTERKKYKIGSRLTLKEVIENAANFSEKRGKICRIEKEHKPLNNN